MVRRLGLAAFVVAVILAIVGPLVLGDALAGVRQRITDLQVPTGAVDDRLTVVELPVEAESWTREQHAELLAAMADDRPVVVGYDVVLAGEAPGDEALATAVRELGVVVLGARARVAPDDAADPPRATTVARPAPALERAAAAVADAAVRPSGGDRIVRTLPVAVEEDDGALLPTLSLATALLAEGGDPASVRAGAEVHVGEHRVPTDERGQLRITWSLPPDMLVVGERAGDVTKVTADEVLADEVSLADRVVLVGVVDAAADDVATPMDRAPTPRVYVHANAVNTMLTGNHRSGPDPMRTLAVVAGLVVVIVLVGLFARLVLLPVVAIGLVAAWQLVVTVQFDAGRDLDSLWPNVAVVLAVLGVLVVRWFGEVRRRRRVAASFDRYLPVGAEREAEATDLAAAAEGQRMAVTLLVGDLDGLTEAVASGAPGEVRTALEAFHVAVARVLHDHGGTVVRFDGEQVLGVFGAPVPRSDHAAQAVAAARALSAALAEAVARAEVAVDLDVAVGLHSGEVVAAHVGGPRRGRFVVVGAAVGVAARMADLAGPGDVVLSRAVREALADVPAVELLGPVEDAADDPEPARLRRRDRGEGDGARD